MNNPKNLLSCPFCGGEAEQQNQVFMGGVKYYPLVKCKTYHCCAGKVWSEIEKWNTRILQWQPIEIAPKNNQILAVLKGCDSGTQRVFVLDPPRNEDESWRFDDCEISNAWDITHWMPLPQPPKE